MNDEPRWTRAIRAGSQVITSALGLGKAKPLENKSFRDLTPTARIRAVKRVLNLSDPIERAQSIASIAEDLGSSRLKDRSAVIKEAIKTFGADGEVGTLAASAIVSARRHLEPTHQSELNRKMFDRPELCKVINDQINHREIVNASRKFNQDALRENGNEARAELKNAHRSRNNRDR